MRPPAASTKPVSSGLVRYRNALFAKVVTEKYLKCYFCQAGWEGWSGYVSPPPIYLCRSLVTTYLISLQGEGSAPKGVLDVDG